MESEAVTHGMRIKFIKEGNLMVSQKIYSNGIQQVRVIINIETMSFKFIEPHSGVTLKESSCKVTNLEVLQRHVKKDLKSYLGIKFTKEKRTVKHAE